jgi:PKD repeat protein
MNTYSWSVSYLSTTGCLPNTSNFSFIGGTNASSINPQIQFTNPGVYTIGLIATSPGGCISTSTTKTVTVKSKPTVSAITATNQICQNGTITPSVTVGNCNATSVATYAWSFPSGSPLHQVLQIREQ